MVTPDEHVRTLTVLAEHYERAAKHFTKTGAEDAPITALYHRRAAAIRWLLALNAYGVAEHEVVI